MVASAKLVKVDPEKYSESSKRSYGYQRLKLGGYYANIEYACHLCLKKDTYTALDQKKAYENRKEYLWATRVLCGECWCSKRAILRECQKVETYYCLHKKECINSAEFLYEWLNLLWRYAKYSHYYNRSRIKFIEKHLCKLT